MRLIATERMIKHYETHSYREQDDKTLSVGRSGGDLSHEIGIWKSEL